MINVRDVFLIVDIYIMNNMNLIIGGNCLVICWYVVWYIVCRLFLIIFVYFFGFIEENYYD